MSLGKVKGNITSGIKDLQSAEGLKRTAVHLGVGVAFGVIADFVLQAVWELGGVSDMLAKAGYAVLAGFTVFPQNTSYRAWDSATQTWVIKEGAWMAWDDVILLIITVALLLTRKIWFVLGFFLGWYFSSYMNLWGALGLPTSLDFLKGGTTP
jgi:hypothetical protein